MTAVFVSRAACICGMTLSGSLSSELRWQPASRAFDDESMASLAEFMPLMQKVSVSVITPVLKLSIVSIGAI